MCLVCENTPILTKLSQLRMELFLFIQTGKTLKMLKCLSDRKALKKYLMELISNKFYFCTFKYGNSMEHMDH